MPDHRLLIDYRLMTEVEDRLAVAVCHHHHHHDSRINRFSSGTRRAPVDTLQMGVQNDYGTFRAERYRMGCKEISQWTNHTELPFSMKYGERVEFHTYKAGNSGTRGDRLENEPGS
ncbi:unnamed protein product [Nippostrongylus brasiliensis]|uniref:Uncharacterized protein n=1 Tax=Nippostrongylus brasiliensis TaxID=27835 RepID=A0A0N4XCP0_NIPBR|nr:unnamed protein product [Nippostrongylus brasiliensis]